MEIHLYQHIFEHETQKYIKLKIKELTVKYLPPQSLACEVYRKQEHEVRDLLPHGRRKINDKMQQMVVKSLYSQSLLLQINDLNALRPCITSSAAVSHVRSLRSNVRKASKISYYLYPLYSYL